MHEQFLEEVRISGGECAREDEQFLKRRRHYQKTVCHIDETGRESYDSGGSC
jgi:hypothetical protein